MPVLSDLGLKLIDLITGFEEGIIEITDCSKTIKIKAFEIDKEKRYAVNVSYKVKGRISVDLICQICGLEFESDDTHFHFYDKKEIINLLDNFRFGIVEISIDGKLKNKRG